MTDSNNNSGLPDIEKCAPEDWHSGVLDGPPARGPWADTRTDPLEVLKQAVLHELRSEALPLFAILDAAQDERVLELLKEHAVQAVLPGERNVAPRTESADQAFFESMYVGEIRESISQTGPWVVCLPQGCELLDVLVGEGWGRAWGYYIAGPGNLYELRQRLRRYLMVTIPDGRIVWFRLADPRVIQPFLDACSPEERDVFLGNYAVLMEDTIPESVERDGPSLIRITAGSRV